MATFTMPMPEPRGGSDAQRIAQMESYLYQLVDQLHFTLSSLDEENMSEAFGKRLTAIDGKSSSIR